MCGQQMHYSQLNFTFSLGFSTDLSPLPYPAHYPKQPTVVNHYQSTHVSPTCFFCLFTSCIRSLSSTSLPVNSTAGSVSIFGNSY